MSKDKKTLKDYIKKYRIILIIVAVIVIICFLLMILKKEKVIFTPINYVSDANDTLTIGERKYLEFLWMVDGAFNYERYNKEEFFVNEKALANKPNFTCVYGENKRTCEASDFESAFNELFSSKIKADKVYGDGVASRWYEKKQGKYLFTNVNSCEAGRMSYNQKLRVKSSEKDKVVYEVTYDEELTEGLYKGNHHYEKEFVLVYENDKWKVSKAYYHDPCYMSYNIE